MQPVSERIIYQPLKQEIEAINASLAWQPNIETNAMGHIWRNFTREPISLSTIQTLLADNIDYFYVYRREGAFPSVQARQCLAKPIAELKRQIVRVYPDSPEKRLAVLQLQQISAIVTPITKSEIMLNEIEEQLRKARHIPAVEFKRDSMGRIIDPGQQLKEFRSEILIRLYNIFCSDFARYQDWKVTVFVRSNLEIYKRSPSKEDHQICVDDYVKYSQLSENYQFISFLFECCSSLPPPNFEIFLGKDLNKAGAYAERCRKWLQENPPQERSLKVTFVLPEIGDFKKVVSIKIKRNYFLDKTPRVLPSRLYELNNLKVLSTTLKPDLKRLKSLTKLRLEKSSVFPILELPPELFEMTRLTNLTIKGSKITEISEAIGNLHMLQMLNIGSNKYLTQLPTALDRLPHLKDIICDDEHLPFLAAVLTEKTSIRRIETQTSALEVLAGQDVVTVLSPYRVSKIKIS